MGLFDNLLNKATEFVSTGKDVSDITNQVKDEVTVQTEETASGASEQIASEVTDTTDQLTDKFNKE
jgi:hypothetical protein